MTDFDSRQLAAWLSQADIADVYRLDQTPQERLLTYMERLVETNRQLNLTAITDTKGVAELHLLDSFSLLPLWDQEQQKQGAAFRWADIGTGAGIPGFVIKLARPDFPVVLIDSTAKRLKFIAAVAEELGIEGVELHHLRAEEAGRLPELRERLHFVTARAVAGLPVLLEYALPLINVGGVFVAMKAHAQEEVTASQNALKQLGGVIEEVREFVLPGTDYQRSLVIVRKEKRTPTTYPRKAGQPQLKPL